MGCGLYGGAGNLLTFVSFCDKNMGVLVICSAGYSPENTVIDCTNFLNMAFILSEICFDPRCWFLTGYCISLSYSLCCNFQYSHMVCTCIN